MALEQSILKSTKKILGLDEGYDAFDLDVITHINSAFVVLKQLGVGPAQGFMIEDDEPVWHDFTGGENGLNAVKTYIYMKVRLLFDPPETSAHLKALEEQITELEHRLKMEKEELWGPPSLLPSLP